MLHTVLRRRANGESVELDRTMSYARLFARLERYDAFQASSLLSS
ncbi:hypothetical protein ACSNOH_09610 [Streptomyces sp. URMC 127]